MMRVSLTMCKQMTVSLPDIPSLTLDFFSPRRQKEKVVILLGATGSGKSRLSVDLATRFPAEIINSDKIQVHKGLDIATNKIPEDERGGVPHHLLGVINPNVDFSAANFVDLASNAMDSISSRSQLPIIAGGSNSYIEALVDDKDLRFRSRYECCFLWVDVAMPVLHRYVSERVDKMVESGMVDELRSYFESNGNANHRGRGIGKAIGVPEFERYFKTEPFLSSKGRARVLNECVEEIKRNTCKLACKQLEKIQRLRNKKKWNIQRVDATAVFQRRGREAEEAWEEMVAGPSTEIVAEFVYNVSTVEAPAAIREYIAQCLAA